MDLNLPLKHLHNSFLVIEFEFDDLHHTLECDAIAIILPEILKHSLFAFVWLVTVEISVVEFAEWLLTNVNDPSRCELLHRFSVDERELISVLQILVVKKSPGRIFCAGEDEWDEAGGEFEVFHIYYALLFLYNEFSTSIAWMNAFRTASSRLTARAILPPEYTPHVSLDTSPHSSSIIFITSE